MHRLLQRAFASLYGYCLPGQDSPDSRRLTSWTLCPESGKDYTAAALEAQNMKDLHYKMKGARFLHYIIYFIYKEYFFFSNRFCISALILYHIKLHDSFYTRYFIFIHIL